MLFYLRDKSRLNTELTNLYSIQPTLLEFQIIALAEIFIILFILI